MNNGKLTIDNLMILHRTQRCILLAFIALLLLPAVNRAQDRPLKKINWGMTALSAAMWIPWIAKDAKIYEKNGLDVEIVLLRGSGQSSQALLGGSLFAAPVALPQVMLADLNGADLVNVAHTIAVASSKLLVKPEIKKPEDLRGKKIATSSIGSLGDFLFRYALRKYGVNPDREITWLSIGTNAERLQALLTGAIDGADVTYTIFSSRILSLRPIRSPKDWNQPTIMSRKPVRTSARISPKSLSIRALSPSRKRLDSLKNCTSRSS